MISGVEAWEMELGETVKRISGSFTTGSVTTTTSGSASAAFESPSPSASATAGGKPVSIGVNNSGSAANAEIGKKAGRKDGERTTGGRRGKDLKRGAGIMNLFAPLGLEEESEERVVGSSRDDSRVRVRTTTRRWMIIDICGWS